MKRLSIIFIICSLFLGCCKQETPQIVYVPVEVIKEVSIEKIIEVPVEVIREVEVIKELRDFASIEELGPWLIKDAPDRHIFLKANSDGVVKLTGVCEDYALQLQNRAFDDGYKMSIQILYDEQYYEHYGTHLKNGQYHAINLVRIGNEFWYIDPKTDEFWLAGYLD